MEKEYIFLLAGRVTSRWSRGRTGRIIMIIEFTKAAGSSLKDYPAAFFMLF